MIQHSQTLIGKEEHSVLNRLLAKGMLTSGNECELLCKEFGNYVGADFTRITSSGTMAFFLILLALEVSKGDEVLIPDYICKDIVGPILILGAKPVLYDNIKESWLSSSDQILTKVTERTRVILVNHTFGFIFKEIKELAGEVSSKIFIVEDCCHAIISKESQFSRYSLKSSHCAFYSFHATKLLASGEGGAICTNDTLIAKSLDKLKIGDRLSDMNCALARVQLRRLNYFLDKRKEISDLYVSAFSAICKPSSELVGLNFRFPIRLKNNVPFWSSNKVAYRKGVDSLVSEELRETPEPNANNILLETVSIPIYPSLKQDQITLIVDETCKLLDQCI